MVGEMRGAGPLYARAQVTGCVEGMLLTRVCIKVEEPEVSATHFRENAALLHTAVTGRRQDTLKDVTAMVSYHLPLLT